MEKAIYAPELPPIMLPMATNITVRTTIKKNVFA